MSGPRRDPRSIAWVHGQRGERPVALAGWVSTDPVIGDVAHLLLHPVGHGVADKMRTLAVELGLPASQDMVAVDRDVTWVSWDERDVWVSHDGYRVAQRPVTSEWVRAAAGQGFLDLWVGLDGATILHADDIDRYMTRSRDRGRLRAGVVWARVP